MAKIEPTTLESKNGYLLQAYMQDVPMNRNNEMKPALLHRVVRDTKPLGVIEDFLNLDQAKALFDRLTTPQA